MAVIRVNKSKDYTVMSNAHLRDRDLSLKAKGLLSQMLSLPEEWNYTVEGLCTINKESKTAIESALGELKEVGYLVVIKLMPNQTKTGRIEYEYNIYEQPIGKQGVEKQGVENQGLEFQGVENNSLLNTDISNTDYKNTENKVLKNNPPCIPPEGKPKRFVKPTLEEVKAYCIERGNGVDAQRFIDYYEASGWKRGKTPIKDWKACVRTWERNDKPKQKSFADMADEIEREMHDTSRYF